jgi:glutamate/tyrosine decarboxylase-like PLP-dependent enzyme
VVARRAAANGAGPVAVAELGLLAACRAAGVAEIRVLTSMAHSSLLKAASVVGLGHESVKEVGVSAEEPWRLDLDAVERELASGEADGVVSIIVVSAGEVNTGRFATNVLDMPKLRSLADRYGAWIHVDGGAYHFCFLLERQANYDCDVDECPSLRSLCACPAEDGRVPGPACTCRGTGAGRQHCCRRTQATERGTLTSEYIMI